MGVHIRAGRQSVFPGQSGRRGPREVEEGNPAARKTKAAIKDSRRFGPLKNYTLAQTTR